eukprot:g18078.t1
MFIWITGSFVINAQEVSPPALHTSTKQSKLSPHTRRLVDSFDCDIDRMGDGYCDEDLNNEDCVFDARDCCICDCHLVRPEEECGRGGFNCINPNSICRNLDDYADCYWPGFFSIECHEENNNAECGYDGGTCVTYCDFDDIGNGDCDAVNYNQACEWDGGDCDSPDSVDDYSEDSSDDSSEDSSEDSFEDSIYPDCPYPSTWIGNNYCNQVANTYECGYDGGDCDYQEDDTGSQSASKDNKGAIAGGVVGGVVGVGAIILLAGLWKTGRLKNWRGGVKRQASKPAEATVVQQPLPGAP